MRLSYLSIAKVSFCRDTRAEYQSEKKKKKKTTFRIWFPFENIVTYESEISDCRLDLMFEYLSSNTLLAF